MPSKRKKAAAKTAMERPKRQRKETLQPEDNQELVQDIVSAVTEKIDIIVSARVNAILSGQSHHASTDPGSNTPLDKVGDTSNSTNLASSKVIESSNVVNPEQAGNGSLASVNSTQSSATVPLHATVHLKVKERIWSNEFVDFRNAFSKPSSEPTFQMTFSDQGVSSCLQTQGKKFISIEQWTDAFQTFSSVYRLKYPDQADNLAQYCNTIRSIAKANGKWFWYDTEFRQLRQNHPIPWNHVQNDLYMQALSNKQPFRDTNNTFTSNKNKNKKPCFKYNKGHNCHPGKCQYAHKCLSCSGFHPQIQCGKSSKGSQQDGYTAKNGPPQPSQSNRPKHPK